METPSGNPPLQINAQRPLSVPPRGYRLPPMTLVLIAVNVLLALVEFAASGYRWQNGQLGMGPIGWALGAKVPTLIAHGEYWRLVTANFLHGSWLHLLMNMVVLLVFGRLIEAFYGPARMFSIYILSSIAGTIVSYLFTVSVSLGASTGILGLLGALLVHNLKYRRYLPPRLTILSPYLIFFVFFELSLDFQNATTDAFGHLGGLLGGIALGLLFESRIAGEQQSERDGLPLPTALASSAAALLYGAFGLLFSLPSSLPLLRAAQSGNMVVEVRQLQHVIRQRPYFTEARMYLIESYIGLREHDAAAAEYAATLAAAPQEMQTPQAEDVQKDLAIFYNTLALQAQNAGRPEDALGFLRQILDLGLDPSVAIELSDERTVSLEADADNSYAYLLADKLDRDYDDAEKHVNAALQIEPQDPEFQDTLAWVHYKQEKYPQAHTDQTEALRLANAASPGPGRDELAALYFHMGAICEKLGGKAEARQNYNKTLSISPAFAEARTALKRLDEPAGEHPAAPFPGGGPVLRVPPHATQVS